MRDCISHCTLDKALFLEHFFLVYFISPTVLKPLSTCSSSWIFFSLISIYLPFSTQNKTMKGIKSTLSPTMAVNPWNSDLILHIFDFPINNNMNTLIDKSLCTSIILNFIWISIHWFLINILWSRYHWLLLLSHLILQRGNLSQRNFKQLFQHSMQKAAPNPNSCVLNSGAKF